MITSIAILEYFFKIKEKNFKVPVYKTSKNKYELKKAKCSEININVVVTKFILRTLNIRPMIKNIPKKIIVDIISLNNFSLIEISLSVKGKLFIKK